MRLQTMMMVLSCFVFSACNNEDMLSASVPQATEMAQPSETKEPQKQEETPIVQGESGNQEPQNKKFAWQALLTPVVGCSASLLAGGTINLVLDTLYAYNTKGTLRVSIPNKILSKLSSTTMLLSSSTCGGLIALTLQKHFAP